MAHVHGLWTWSVDMGIFFHQWTWTEHGPCPVMVCTGARERRLCTQALSKKHCRAMLFSNTGHVVVISPVSDASSEECSAVEWYQWLMWLYSRMRASFLLDRLSRSKPGLHGTSFPELGSPCVSRDSDPDFVDTWLRLATPRCTCLSHFLLNKKNHFQYLAALPEYAGNVSEFVYFFLWGWVPCVKTLVNF